MRVESFVVSGLLALTGCVSTAVDYSALQSSAEARQRGAGLNAAPVSRNVNALLARPLTAESAAQVAVLNNRGVRATVQELAAAQAALATVRRLPNPTVEGAMRFRGEGDPELEVGAMIDLTELLLTLPRGGAAASAADAARLSAVGAILDLSFHAREAFFEYQAALQLLELRRTVMQALSASADVADRLRAAGNITELELASQQSIFQEARLNYHRSEAALAAARERLNAAMGLWGRGTEWQAHGRLPELPDTELATTTLEADAVRHSLDLEIAKARFAAAAKRANASRAAGLLPELKAGVSAERDEEWAVGPAVELELPLFYQGQGEVALARAEMRQQQELYTDTAVRLRAAARDLATRLGAARSAVTYYRDVLLPLKQKIVDETQLQYNAMSIGIFQLLQAKRDQVETAGAYIEQLREYWVARTRAEQLLSGRLGDQAPGDTKVPMSAAGTGGDRTVAH
jgi:cobalt-zinc-cadmium efflux system outer membrane protein